MVAQEVLVLLVLVRTRVVQPAEERDAYAPRSLCLHNSISSPAWSVANLSGNAGVLACTVCGRDVRVPIVPRQIQQQLVALDGRTVERI